MRALLLGMAETFLTEGDPADCVTFAARQIECLPVAARVGVGQLALLFSLHALWRGGKPFAAQPAEQRAAQMAAWRRSAFAPCRNFVGLCEGLMRFAHYAGKRGT